MNIATTLVADAATRTTDSALILSADSVLAPAIRTARSLNTTMFLAAAFPPLRYSAELSNLMPASFSIGMSKLTRSKLARTVVDSVSGRTYNRPAKSGIDDGLAVGGSMRCLEVGVEFGWCADAVVQYGVTDVRAVDTATGILELQDRQSLLLGGFA